MPGGVFCGSCHSARTPPLRRDFPPPSANGRPQEVLLRMSMVMGATLHRGAPNTY